MEAKTVMLSFFIMSLVMTQIQVEAKICCPSVEARKIYNSCRFTIGDRCLILSGCIRTNAKICLPPYDHGILEISGDGVNEYCKLGCVSSVCSALITIQNSSGSEIVNGAVEQCAKACSTFCTKGSMAAVETA